MRLSQCTNPPSPPPYLLDDPLRNEVHGYARPDVLLPIQVRVAAEDDLLPPLGEGEDPVRDGGGVGNEVGARHAGACWEEKCCRGRGSLWRHEVTRERRATSDRRLAGRCYLRGAALGAALEGQHSGAATRLRRSRLTPLPSNVPPQRVCCLFSPPPFASSIDCRPLSPPQRASRASSPSSPRKRSWLPSLPVARRALGLTSLPAGRKPYP